MENASKALLISGAVLIAILLLTLFSYLFTRMGEHAAGIYEQMEETDVREFNEKFLKYNKQNITMQDLVTIVNLAIQSNNEQKYIGNISVTVNKCRCDLSVPIGDWTIYYKNDVNKILEDHLKDVDSNSRFYCTVTINKETAVVNSIKLDLIEETI